MWRWLAIALLLIGCKRLNPKYCEANPQDPDCGGMVRTDGGRMDGRVDGLPDATGCFGGGAFELCPMGMPAGEETLSGNLNTDTSALCSSAQLWRGNGQTPSCFIVRETITVTNLDVTGSRPLVLVANDLMLSGLFDIASHIGGTTGPGVPAGSCGTYGNAVTAAQHGGGGAGAALAPMGGPGGDGGSGNNGGAAGGTGYAPFLAVPPDVLRAGCNGQNGATGTSMGGAGGAGGGAALLAGVRITLGGGATINASGAGAGQALKQAGGGGGGSGGMIILHADSFNVSVGAKLVANGGSGSSGGDGNASGLGAAGNDPNPLQPDTPAPGGNDDLGGDGGDGYAGGNNAKTGVNGGASAGGGGGGGGGGYIQANKPLTNVMASPPVVVP